MKRIKIFLILLFCLFGLSNSLAMADVYGPEITLHDVPDRSGGMFYGQVTWIGKRLSEYKIVVYAYIPFKRHTFGSYPHWIIQRHKKSKLVPIDYNGYFSVKVGRGKKYGVLLVKKNYRPKINIHCKIVDALTGKCKRPHLPKIGGKIISKKVVKSKK